MKNVKVMCINLYMIVFIYVLIIFKEIRIKYMENYMYREGKNLGVFNILKYRKFIWLD